MEPHKFDSIAPLDESLQFITSDDEEQRHWKMQSIYRVPARITTLNGEAYQPQVVSIGPYHHGEAHLLPMEEHKLCAVRHFLKRSEKPMESFFESLREVAWDLEESYDALDPKWKAAPDDYVLNDPIFSYHGFLYMMNDIWKDMSMLENQLPMLVLERLVAVESDGKEDDQFVSMLILKLWYSKKAIKRMGKCLHFLDVIRKGTLMERKKDEEEVTFLDFTLSEDVIAISIRPQSQIQCADFTPTTQDDQFVSMLILKLWKGTLMERKKDEEEVTFLDFTLSEDVIARDKSVNRLILNFCSPSKGIARMGKYLHVPDFFRKCMLLDPKKKDDVDRLNFLTTIQLATELDEHGIWFKINKTDSIKDISFADGVLMLPYIQMMEVTMSCILNIMAFERLHVRAGNEVTSCIYCMGHIITKGWDVTLLRAQGIIVHFLASDEAVAKTFNLLTCSRRSTSTTISAGTCGRLISSTPTSGILGLHCLSLLPSSSLRSP
ncbi:UPF0481 protein At3g47200-like [Eucalyptus grandis]|uniref:UPF0481 protein At3g47200-like n=1 Tax=Eucalyptus grandis TaxID=71139 RepID=UPI00192E9509|nr:UPF0481 protein At3g47200-like [Eucalyptus grandis]